MSTKWNKPVTRTFDYNDSQLRVTLNQNNIEFKLFKQKNGQKVNLFDLYKALSNKTLCLSKECKLDTEVKQDLQTTTKPAVDQFSCEYK